MVVPVPAPGRDDRQRQDPALAQQVAIDIGIVLGHLVGRVGEVELDRSAAARLQVDEPHPVPRHQDVARVRLAVQQLLAARARADRPSQASQRVYQQGPVGVRECRRLRRARHQPLRLLDPLGEVRRGHVEAPHAGVQPVQRGGVVGRCRLWPPHRGVVGPQRDREPVPRVHPRLHPAIGNRDRAAGRREPLRELDLERCGPVRRRRHLGQHVARQQPQGQPVRVLQDDRVVDPQAQLGGRRDRGGHRGRTLCCSHAR
ncbi:hypothetical protein, partial [Actinocatenispora thailandica]|uniref:hypothetical protein n=1 Tax=Actinocatenispora thailandica TaxID=227318 RepID=UPI0031DF8C9A